MWYMSYFFAWIENYIIHVNIAYRFVLYTKHRKYSAKVSGMFKQTFRIIMRKWIQQLHPKSTEPGGLKLPLSQNQDKWDSNLRGSNPSALVISWPHYNSLNPQWAQSIREPWPLCICLASTMTYPCHKARCWAQ